MFAHEKGGQMGDVTKSSARPAPAKAEFRTPFDAPTPELIVFAFRDGGEKIFQINGGSIDTSASGDVFVLRVHNRSGQPISVELDGQHTSSTAHIENGQDGGLTDTLGNYAGRQSKCIRWRPGFLGFWGDGGGELWFTFDSTQGSGLMEITVTG
jgi:hypothetical protein